MRARFCEIAYVEFDFSTFETFPNCEVEPEDITSRVGIYPQKQIIFIITHLDYTVQITPLEAWLKNQLLL